MLIFNSSHTAGKSDIYTLDDDGSHLHCLTSPYSMQRYQRLRLSPHRDRLLFYAFSPRQDNFRFLFWELGSDRLDVYEQEPYPHDMQWLTNDRLLCTRKEKRWITDLEHPIFFDLDFFDDDLLMMAIAPDGNRVLLKQGPGVGGNIYVGEIGQRQVRKIFHADDKEKSSTILYPSSWSPDGKMIACVGGFEDEIWLINADGSDPHMFANGDFYWMEFQWSPDSQRIAYTRSLDGRVPHPELAGVFVRDLQGGDEKQVLLLEKGGVWRWTPDGQSLVYSQNKAEYASLVRVNVHTGIDTEVIGPAAAIKDIAELIVV